MAFKKERIKALFITIIGLVAVLAVSSIFIIFSKKSENATEPSFKKIQVSQEDSDLLNAFSSKFINYITTYGLKNDNYTESQLKELFAPFSNTCSDTSLYIKKTRAFAGARSIFVDPNSSINSTEIKNNPILDDCSSNLTSYFNTNLNIIIPKEQEINDKGIKTVDIKTSFTEHRLQYDLYQGGDQSESFRGVKSFEGQQTVEVSFIVRYSSAEDIKVFDLLPEESSVLEATALDPNTYWAPEGKFKETIIYEE